MYPRPGMGRGAAGFGGAGWGGPGSMGGPGGGTGGAAGGAAATPAAAAEAKESKPIVKPSLTVYVKHPLTVDDEFLNKLLQACGKVGTPEMEAG